MGGTRGWGNHRRYFWGESDYDDYEQRYEESSSGGTVNDGFIEFQVSVAFSALTEMQWCAGIWQIIWILLNCEDMNYYWGGTANYCTDLVCELNEELKHQIEDSEGQNLAEIA